MLRFLKAKMVEKNVSEDDIARLLGRSVRCIRGKIAEETAFTFPEAKKMRDTYFPHIDIDKLLASDKFQSTA